MKAFSSRGLSLLSGGLDSQLAICILREAGADVEGVTFETPFFSSDAARRAAQALHVKLHVIDFTADEIALIENPPHGFGSAMNPCIDCHAQMIRRAGELMSCLGYDFVATGEVLNQRPMSQNKQSLHIVEKASGCAGRLVRPLSAQLLEPTIPEQEGLLDRSRLLGLSGRTRETQLKLATQFGLVDYPSPAGGCRLTEKGFALRLNDLLTHEGLGDRRLVELLNEARRFRLSGGTSVILGRDARENAHLKKVARPHETLVAPISVPGPTALLPHVACAEDLAQVCEIVCAWSRYDAFEGDLVVRIWSDGHEEERTLPRPYSRETYLPFQIRQV